MGNKRCNPSRIIIKFNLVKSPFKIQTTEHCSFIQVVKNIIHSRYWMSFSDHGLVCLTHVCAYSYLLCSSFWHHYPTPWISPHHGLTHGVGPSTFSIMSAFNSFANSSSTGPLRLEGMRLTGCATGLTFPST